MGLQSIKNFILGKPLETWKLSHELIPKWKALPVFSSDALSSIAYATQEILIPLSVASAYALTWLMPIGFAITLLMIVVGISYAQTIRCYPQGGGAYIVARENLGTNAGLVAGAALLVDYVLTVSVSVTSGVEAITSAVPELYPLRIYLGILAIFLVMLINLRGIKESGTFFSLPTYLFVISIFVLLGTACFKYLTHTLYIAETPLHPSITELKSDLHEVGIFLLLKAFSSGCSALTGIEAISNGVPAFKEPKSRNARITLFYMVFILATSFLGITYLTDLLAIHPSETNTVISQIGETIFGRGFFYYFLQISTALILFLAANTSFADFPRVCSLLAHDRFLPRQLASLGDKLVFSKGILILGGFSSFLIFLFHGTTHYLIPLYAVGVFLSFTLSQLGMVVHHIRVKEKGWRLGVIFSCIGALTTAIVSLVISIAKFTGGAWIIIILVPLLVIWFRLTREHYRKVAQQLVPKNTDLSRIIKHVVIVPISGLHQGTFDALKYALSISKDVRVVYVDMDEKATQRLLSAWNSLSTKLNLVILPSPYRSILRPILDYIKSVDREAEDDMLTVVIPEFVTAHWWERIYHNQTAFLIRTALLFDRGKVVTSIRYFLSK